MKKLPKDQPGESGQGQSTLCVCRFALHKAG